MFAVVSFSADPCMEVGSWPMTHQNPLLPHVAELKMLKNFTFVAVGVEHKAEIEVARPFRHLIVIVVVNFFISLKRWERDHSYLNQLQQLKGKIWKNGRFLPSPHKEICSGI